MEKIIIIIFTIFITQSVFSQSYYQYNIATGTTTTVNYTNVSVNSSANTNSNSGVLPQNLSGDTSRNFTPLDIVNDPSAFPWRFAVKVGDCSGILIDPYHVLTAGHVVDFVPSFGSVKIIPAYNNSEMPYGFALPIFIYRPTTYSITSATDFAIIKLDRPLGSLVGWSGYGYNNSNTFFTTNKFYNPNYPSGSPFDGNYLYNWKNNFDLAQTDFVYSYRTGITGMSGSAAYSIVSGQNVTYAVLVASGVKFNRLTATKYDLINKVLSDDTPASFDAIPMWVKTYPENIKNNSAPDSVTLIIHNYSSETKSNVSLTVDIYISDDSIITTSDTKLKTTSFTNNYSAKGSVSLKLTGLSTISKSNGTYYIGAIISGDNNSANNISSGYEVSRISVSSNTMFTIYGRVTSTQSGNGISGVSLNGFPQSVTTDFNGNYYARIPSGWSGIVTPAKTGFTFTNASTSYSNITVNTNTNYTTVKQTFLLSGYAKSPVSQRGVCNVKIQGIPSEPYTDANGYYSVRVYYGFSARVMPIKTNWRTTPSLIDYFSVTSDKSESLTCGLYITGFTYNSVGQRLPFVSLNGFPMPVSSDSTGAYFAVVDSNWSGIVSASKGPVPFNPSSLSYSNIKTSYTLKSYSMLSAPAINVRVFLSGAFSSGKDTMTTTLNYKNFLPTRPPDTLSGKNTFFRYIPKSYDTLSTNFFANNRLYVDWIILLVKDSLFNNVDTVAALLRRDGRVFSLWGDSLVQLKYTTVSKNYFITVLHRNHIAVMSSNYVLLTYNTALYDFSTGLNKYYGGEAKLLKTGLYGMYVGDVDRNGIINLNDFESFDNDNLNAVIGYVKSDFNMDGYVTGTDFNLLAPNKRNNIASKLPN